MKMFFRMLEGSATLSRRREMDLVDSSSCDMAID